MPEDYMDRYARQQAEAAAAWQQAEAAAKLVPQFGALGVGAYQLEGPNVRPGINEALAGVEEGIAQADKAAQMLYEVLSAAGVLRPGALADSNYKKERGAEVAEAPMLGRVLAQQRQINDLTRALHVLRDSLAF